MAPGRRKIENEIVKLTYPLIFKITTAKSNPVFLRAPEVRFSSGWNETLLDVFSFPRWMEVAGTHPAAAA